MANFNSYCFLPLFLALSVSLSCLSVCLSVCLSLSPSLSLSLSAHPSPLTCSSLKYSEGQLSHYRTSSEHWCMLLFWYCFVFLTENIVYKCCVPKNLCYPFQSDWPKVVWCGYFQEGKRKKRAGVGVEKYEVGTELFGGCGDFSRSLSNHSQSPIS